MNPETRAFLDRVRHADDPTPDDERRVLTAVRTSLAAGARTGAGQSKLRELLAAFGAPKVKAGSLALCLVAAAAAAESAWLEPAANEPLPPAATSVRGTPRAPAAGSASARPERVPVNPPASASTSISPPTERQLTPRVGSTAPRPPGLRDELALLMEVQAALKRGDSAAALERLDQHATTDRQLLAERQAARILALCAAGRTGEAREAAAQFLHQHPASPQRTAVARSCAAETPTDER